MREFWIEANQFMSDTHIASTKPLEINGEVIHVREVRPEAPKVDLDLAVFANEYSEEYFSNVEKPKFGVSKADIRLIIKAGAEWQRVQMKKIVYAHSDKIEELQDEIDDLKNEAKK